MLGRKNTSEATSAGLTDEQAEMGRKPVATGISQREFLRKLAGALGLASIGVLAVQGKKAEATYYTGTPDRVDTNLQVDGNLTVGGTAGVGTASPRSSLEVGGPGTLRITNLAQGPTWLGWVLSQDSSGHLDISYPTRAQHALYLEYESGKVGVGTSAPVASLDVAGDLHVASEVRTMGSIKVNNTVAIDTNATARQSYYAP